MTIKSNNETATRAEISRSRLTGNFSRLRDVAQRSGSDLLAVVKADAYGHGVSLCAPWLEQAGAEWLGVTSLAEGAAVRRLCPTARILVMSGLECGDATGLLNARLDQTVWDAAHLEALAELARRHGLGPGTLPVHLEVDTGMSRQGIGCGAEEMAPFLERLRSIPALRLEGAFTHFAAPEVLGAEQNRLQTERFRHAVEQIAAAGFRPAWVHAGNSSTLLAQRETEPLAALAKGIGARFLFRPGLALYGYALPFTDGTELPVKLEPVMAWKTAVASLRTVKPGAEVGYNGTFVATERMRLALLPVGYADGLNRRLSNRGHVLVRGVEAPIIGRVSMDLTIADVTEISDVAVGDAVVLIGEQEEQRITAEDPARWAETIPYEILCAVGARVPRVAED